MTKQIELLSPAGDMERLKMSLAYGADAVYLAAPLRRDAQGVPRAVGAQPAAVGGFQAAAGR